MAIFNMRFDSTIVMRPSILYVRQRRFKFQSSAAQLLGVITLERFRLRVGLDLSLEVTRSLSRVFGLSYHLL